MVLFLDFDGVLHPDPCPAGRQFEHARVLTAALTPFLMANRLDIVLSTSWRSVEPVNVLKARLPAALAARVVGVTPLFSAISAAAGRLYPYRRQAECVAWIEANAPTRAWHALDDRAEWFEPYCEQLTLCDARCGLTAASLAHLVSALERMRRVAHRSPASE